MAIALKTLLVIFLAIIVLQDIKHRQVYWFAFPIVGILCAVLHYQNVPWQLFWYSVLLNLLIVCSLLLSISIYMLFKKKLTFKDVIGTGDILFFIAVSFSFSTVSFITILVASLIFSLVTHLIYSRKSKYHTVPLAGYMSLFFGLTYLGFWLGLTNVLYSI